MQIKNSKNITVMSVNFFKGGGSRGSDPCRDRGSEETGFPTDVRRTGTTLSGLEPQTEASESLLAESRAAPEDISIIDEQVVVHAALIQPRIRFPGCWPHTEFILISDGKGNLYDQCASGRGVKTHLH